MGLTVVCVWVNGHVPFTVEYVTKLEAMARRCLSRPFDFICLTDRPWLVPAHIRTIPIQLRKGLKGWWAKLEVFAPNRFHGRVLYLDLDTLVVDRLDAIVDYPSPFALAPHEGTFDGKDGLRVVKRFNSSVMVWNADAPARLLTSWTPAVAADLWGDQDWIGEQYPQADTMPLPWFPRLSACRGVPADAKVILCKKPKNVNAAKQFPWVREAWA